MIKNVITINDFSYSQGGASKVAIDYANIIAKNGLNSVYICAVSDKGYSELHDKVEFYSLESQEFLKYRNKLKGALNSLRNFKFTKFVLKVLKHYNPDETIINVHGWTKACSSHFVKKCLKLKYKIYLTVHEYFLICPNGALYNYKKKEACALNPGSFNCKKTNCDSRSFSFKLFRNVRTFFYKMDFNKNVNLIFISEFEKTKFEKTNFFKYNTKYVLNNYVSIVQKDDVSEKYDFIYIGRTDLEKGIDIFIQLVEYFKEKKFLIVGNYSQNHYINLETTGWVPQNKVDEYLAMSKCLVFPSLWPETFGINVIKSIYMGKKCLISSNTAAVDFSKYGNCYIFAQNNIEDAILKCNQMLNDANNEIVKDKIKVSETNFFNELIKIYNSKGDNL